MARHKRELIAELDNAQTPEEMYYAERQAETWLHGRPHDAEGVQRAYERLLQRKQGRA